AYTQEPWLSPEGLAWRPAPTESGDLSVLRPASDPFSADGGLKLLRGNLGRDVVVVVRYQGPRANGMPELHQLTPALASLQSKGFKVALVTDGRMSGASGTVPAAIHVSPECLHGGPLGKIRDGDIVRLDSLAGTLSADVPEEVFSRREVATP